MWHEYYEKGKILFEEGKKKTAYNINLKTLN